MSAAMESLGKRNKEKKKRMAYQRHQNWQVNESGILRKKEENEEEELLVFGYACKLFRDDEKALYVDQGKHLIPWMGNESLRIDRYDVRGALYDLSQLEASSGGGEEPLWFNLSAEELRVEQMCDEERYRALTHNEDEEALYQEEELKRLHLALGSDKAYGQVSYKYDDNDNSNDKNGEEKSETNDQTVQKDDIDEPFKPSPDLDVPVGMVLPDSVKLNAIIEKTAMFIDRQGCQMEIVLKIKQAGNPQFNFLSLNSPLHPYYRHLLAAIKAGRYRPVIPTASAETNQDKNQVQQQNNYYLHSSLAPVSSSVDVAPVIPTINYKPSADCAYSMLVNRIKGNQNKLLVSSNSTTPPSETLTSKEEDANSCDGNLLPEQVESPALKDDNDEVNEGTVVEDSLEGQSPPSRPARPPKRRRRKRPQGGCAYYDPLEQEMESTCPEMPVEMEEEETVMYCEPPPQLLPPPPEEPPPSVQVNKEPEPVAVEVQVQRPPPELELIIDKMASYVAKNGRDFESIVRSKGDPRFYFLHPTDQFHLYYCKQVEHYESLAKPVPDELSQDKPDDDDNVVDNVDENSCDSLKKDNNSSDSSQKSDSKRTLMKPSPVCFSIKKPKESEGLEIKSALPVEESSEDEEGKDDEDADGKKEDGDKVSEVEVVQVVGEEVEDKKVVVIPEKWADERVKDKLAAAARDKLALKEREKQLQLERKRRAAAFINRIHHKQPVIGPQLPPGEHSPGEGAAGVVSTPPSSISSPEPEQKPTLVVPTIEIDDSADEIKTPAAKTTPIKRKKLSLHHRPSIASAKAYMEYYKASESKRMRSEYESLKRRHKKSKSSSRKQSSHSHSSLALSSSSSSNRRRRRSSREHKDKEHHRKHKHRRRPSGENSGSEKEEEEARRHKRHKHRHKSYKAKKHKRKEVEKSESSSSSSSSDSD